VTESDELALNDAVVVILGGGNTRSRTRNRTAEIRSRSDMRFRAAYVVHTIVGWAVTPRMWTRRLAISMTNSA
jgi:hypothetical protein